MDNKIIDVNQFPHHMRGDYEKRNANIRHGFKLCERCGGTGNELMSMYKQCQACNGDGIHNNNWDYTKE